MKVRMRATVTKEKNQICCVIYGGWCGYTNWRIVSCRLYLRLLP